MDINPMVFDYCFAMGLKTLPPEDLLRILNS